MQGKQITHAHMRRQIKYVGLGTLHRLIDKLEYNMNMNELLRKCDV